MVLAAIGNIQVSISIGLIFLNHPVACMATSFCFQDQVFVFDWELLLGQLQGTWRSRTVPSSEILVLRSP